MSMSKFYCTLLLTLLRFKFCIGGNYALFEVKFFRLKFGWCTESDILHVCVLAAEQLSWHAASGGIKGLQMTSILSYKFFFTLL